MCKETKGLIFWTQCIWREFLIQCQDTKNKPWWHWRSALLRHDKAVSLRQHAPRVDWLSRPTCTVPDEVLIQGRQACSAPAAFHCHTVNKSTQRQGSRRQQTSPPPGANLLPLYTMTVKQCGAPWRIRGKFMTSSTLLQHGAHVDITNATRFLQKNNTIHSTKLEVHNLLHCCQRTTKPRPQVTFTGNFVKFGHVANRQTDIQTRRSQYIANNLLNWLSLFTVNNS